MKREFKIPSIVGIVILLLAVMAGVYLTQSKVSFKSGASGDCSPNNLQTTNVTHNSASISFTTTSSCLTSVNVNNLTYNNYRSATSHIHYFEIKHLSEQTDYKFIITSGGQSLTQDSYHFRTAITPTNTIPTSNLAWGKVYNADRNTPAVAIVYLNIPGASILSSVVTTDGNWSVSLANTFNESKNNWFSPPLTPVSEDIVVISDDGVITQVTNTTNNNNPVPDIIVGTNSLEAPIITPSPQSGQIDSLTPILTTKKVDILNPKDGDILSTDRPDFFGSAPLNSTVIIEVHSAVVVNGQTVSDSSGNWNWSPPTGLPPGQHTITAKVQNASTGVWSTITRNFVVLAADNSNTGPQYVASGSATTPTPTLTPAPTSSPVPTVRATRPSVTIEPPVTGNSASTVLIVIASLIFFLISVRFIK